MYHFGFKKIGEPPVILDSAAVQKSARNISVYLLKKGFTENEVHYEIGKIPFRRRGKVTYFVTEGKRLTIKGVEVKSTNKSLAHVVRYNGKSLLKPGNPVDYDLIGAERNRINDLMRDKGYFQFNRSLVEFELDTTVGNDEAFVLITILEDTRRPQRPYKIGNVLTEIETGDSIADTLRTDGGHYVLNGMPLNTFILEQSTLLRKGELYKQSLVSGTYEKLIGLGMFSSVDVRLTPKEESDTGEIDVYIRLVAAPKHDLIWEPQVVTTEQRFREDISTRNYGLANELTLKNKNVLRNGEEFNVRLRTALETQFTRDSNSVFSTFIQEVNTELKVPHLLFAPSLAEKVNARNSSTRLNLSYLYERNQFYLRNLLPLTFSYEFVQNKGVMYWTPVLISLNKATFNQSLLDDLGPGYLEAQQRLFTNNLITSQKLSGVYTNRDRSPSEFWYVNSNMLEMAGMVLPQLTDYGSVFGVRHSTFLRSDADVRYTHHINPNNTVVVRLFGGLGVPVGERSLLPFERRFFAGGSNSLRAWRLRTVGPGSFSNDTSSIQFARSGEIGFTSNFEYRFGIIEAAVDVEGALFLDAGNVWNLKRDTLFPGGEFRFNRFYKELAINSGIGLRLDFDFLVLRFDLGVPLWDPNEALESRWVFVEPWKLSWARERTVWNVAVGYPF